MNPITIPLVIPRFTLPLIPLLLLLGAPGGPGLLGAGRAGARVADPYQRAESRPSCEPISVGMCQGIGYNETRMPNHAKNDNQLDAKHEMSSYEPLLKIKCSSQLQFFLCSVYFPMCNQMIQQSIGPCRPLCENVRRRCEPTLKTFGFEWPEALNCSKFPAVNNARTMCMKGPSENDDSGPSSSAVLNPGAHSGNHQPPLVSGGASPGVNGGQDFWDSRSSFPPGGLGRSHFANLGAASVLDRWGKCKNLPVLARDVSYVYLNNTKRCAPHCGPKILFDEAKRNTAFAWMGALTGISLVLTLVALVPLFVSSVQLYYPERSVAFITLCHGLSSVGYLIRLFSGHTSVACTTISDLAEPVLVIQGLQNLRCTIVFVFQYYFTFVAAMWWLVLCGTLFYLSVPSWSALTLQKRATVYHGIVWTLPGVLTVVILVRAAVEADDLTGLCNVGSVNVSELLQFVILPNLVCLIFGAILLALGVVTAVFRSTSTGGQFSKAPAGVPGGPAPSSLGGRKSPQVPRMPEGFMVKLGFLALFYILPCVGILAANFYEYSNRPRWIPTVPWEALKPDFLTLPLRSASLSKRSTDFLKTSARPQISQPPNFDFFVMKICASLIYGICTSVWLIIRVCHHHCPLFAGGSGGSSTRNRNTGGGSSSNNSLPPNSYAYQVATPLTGSSASNPHPANPKMFRGGGATLRSTPSPNYHYPTAPCLPPADMAGNNCGIGIAANGVQRRMYNFCENTII